MLTQSKKTSLNIKIPEELDARLKRARATARQNGFKFNVSQEVTQFLERKLAQVEKQLKIEQDITEHKSQSGFTFDVESGETSGFPTFENEPPTPK